MKQYLVNRSLPEGAEPVRLERGAHVKYRGVVVFLICCGLLLAAFAVSSVWLEHEDFLGLWKDAEVESEGDRLPCESDDTKAETPTGELSVEEALPKDAIPVITMDLSYPSLGREYLHNETVYRPSVSELLEVDVSCADLGDAPLVLVFHTHTSESYLPSGSKYIEGAVGDATYSQSQEENVLAVGKALCQALHKKGITAIHCTVMHDAPSLSGAYDRSEATVRQYLEQYPSIKYVIDLHRDAILTAEGAYVRAACSAGEETFAQVMAVVGSDGNGTEHSNWKGNLALALQLREKLNAQVESLCRPVSLRCESFHQELAPSSLLLEIGTGGNSIEEAKRSAIVVGNALAELILKVREPQE